jgi:hypothetical protein
VIAKESAEIGKEPPTPQPRRADEDVAAKAAKQLKDNPDAAEKLAKKLLRQPRPTTDVERHVLLQKRNEINAAHRQATEDVNAAIDAKDVKGEIEARERQLLLEDQRGILDLASDVSGSEAGRALRAVGLRMDEHGDLVYMLNTMKSALGRELTAAERTHYTELQAKMAEQQKIIDDLRAKQDAAGNRKVTPAAAKKANDAYQSIIDKIKSIPGAEHMTKECAL